MSFSPEVWRDGLAPAVVLGGVAGASFLLYLLGGEKVSKWLEKREENGRDKK